MSLLTAEWLKTPTHAASFFISSPIALFLQRAAEPEMPRLHNTAELTRWQLHLMTSTPNVTRVPTSTTIVQHPISTRGSTEKRNSKEPKNQKNKQKKKINVEEKSLRVGLNPSYRYLLRRRAISSDHSDPWRYLCRRYHRWRYFLGGKAIGRKYFGGRRFFAFLAVTISAEAVKPRYGGSLSARLWRRR